MCAIKSNAHGWYAWQHSSASTKQTSRFLWTNTGSATSHVLEHRRFYRRCVLLSHRNSCITSCSQTWPYKTSCTWVLGLQPDSQCSQWLEWGGRQALVELREAGRKGRCVILSNAPNVYVTHMNTWHQGYFSLSAHGTVLTLAGVTMHQIIIALFTP